MKKLMSLSISLLIVLSAVYVPFGSAYAAGSGSVAYHEDGQLFNDSLTDDTDYGFSDSVTKTYKGAKYYTRGKQLYQLYKTQLEQRKSSIVVHLLAKSAFSTSATLRIMQIYDLEDELLSCAASDQLSQSGTDGDYLRWSTIGWNATYQLDNIDGYYFYTFRFNYNYLETDEQEKQIKSEISKFISSLDTNSLSDYEIIKRIHDYICSKTTYCYDALDGNYEDFLYAYSPYGALIKGSCVCQGYARAFYRICEELGYNCRVMTSEYSSSGGLFAIPDTGHAWNLVEVNGKYYFVDATWDDEFGDKGYDNKKYTFLLVNDSTIKSYDSGKEHTPSNDYDNDYYRNKYQANIDTENYDSSDKTLLSNCTVTLSKSSYTYSGKALTPSVSVISPDGSELDADAYSVSYSSNTNTGIATVKISADGSVTHRQFSIKPQKMGKMWLKSGTKTTLAMTLCWNPRDGKPDGYYIQQYKDGKWSWIKTVSGTSASFTSLSPATTYSFRVRAYKNYGSRRIYGDFSPVYTNTTLPKKPTLTLKTSNKTITASWKKVRASGYEIQRSTSNKFGDNTTTYLASRDTASKKFKKLKKGRIYYIRVRAYKTYNGHRYYSAWSKTKSIKCK